MSDAKALPAMLFAVFTWSLYPVMGALGVEQIDTITFVACIQTLSFVAATGLGWWLLRKHGLMRNFRRILRVMNTNHIIIIVIAGICSNLAHFGLLYSLSMANKAGAYIVFETAPIISMFLIPAVIAKPWEKLGIADWVAAILALTGVAIIIFTDTVGLKSESGPESVSLSPPVDIAELAGYGCAFMGAITMAFSDLLRAQIALLFKGLKRPFISTLLSESLCRLAAIPVAVGVAAVYSGTSQFDGVNLLSMFFIGVVIYTLGSAAYTLALLYAKRPSITLVWYLMPVLSLIWLYATGISEVNQPTLFGALLILWSSFMLALRFQEAPPTLQNNRIGVT